MVFLFGTAAFTSIAAQTSKEKADDTHSQKMSKTQDAPSAFTPAQKKELLQLILTSIEGNPQAIKQSLEKYLAFEAQQQAAKEELLAKKRIQDNEKELFQSTDTPFIGVKEAPQTLVLFVDPYCGYCRKSLEDLERLVAENKDIQVSIRNLAILGPASEWAVKALMAAKRQGKYNVFQTALKKTNQPLEKQQLIDLAQTLGIDLPLFKTQLEQADIRQEYEKNMALAAALGISATPTLIVEDHILQGYVPFAEIQAQIKLPTPGESKTSGNFNQEAPKNLNTISRK